MIASLEYFRCFTIIGNFERERERERERESRERERERKERERNNEKAKILGWQFRTNLSYLPTL